MDVMEVTPEGHPRGLLSARSALETVFSVYAVALWLKFTRIRSDSPVAIGTVRTRAPTFAPMYLLSANGTLRTILILLIIWQLLRLWMKVQQNKRPGGAARWSSEPRRPKGDVRIERLEDVERHPPPLEVEDADFEEIKDKPDH